MNHNTNDYGLIFTRFGERDEERGMRTKRSTDHRSYKGWHVCPVNWLERLGGARIAELPDNASFIAGAASVRPATMRCCFFYETHTSRMMNRDYDGDTVYWFLGRTTALRQWSALQATLFYSIKKEYRLTILRYTAEWYRFVAPRATEFNLRVPPTMEHAIEERCTSAWEIGETVNWGWEITF